jgi:hypothetical protein
MTTCEKCPVGKRGQAAAGTSTLCIDCGVGAVSAIEGATECTPCTGDTSTMMNSTASSCSPCLDGEITDSVHAMCKTCVNGQYRAKPADSSSDRSTCVSCPALGVDCRGGRLTLKTGAWYSVEHNPIVDENTDMHTCFNDECCLAEEVACDKSKGYMGALCGGCDLDNDQGRGSFTRSGSGCFKCWELWTSWSGVSGIGCVVLVALIYLVVHHTFAVAVGDHSTCDLVFLMLLLART